VSRPLLVVLAAMVAYAVFAVTLREAPSVLRLLLPFALVALALALGQGAGPGEMLRLTGLASPIGSGLVWGLVASLPMALILAVAAGGLDPDALREPLNLVRKTLGAGLAEEVFFRGLVFLQLYRVWGFGPAMVVSGAFFGLMHLPSQLDRPAVELLGVAVITGVGGAFYAWLLARWENLWLLVALHAAMNLWWTLFAAGSNAVGGGAGNLARAATIMLLVVVTANQARWPWLTETLRARAGLVQARR